jgi:argininosuccinate lyase
MSDLVKRYNRRALTSARLTPTSPGSARARRDAGRAKNIISPEDHAFIQRGMAEIAINGRHLEWQRWTWKGRVPNIEARLTQLVGRCGQTPAHRPPQ